MKTRQRRGIISSITVATILITLRDHTGKDGDLAGSVGAIGISGCLNASAAMDAVATNEFEGVVLSGEPEFIGSAGEGSAIDAVLSYYQQSIAQTENDIWEYYKITVSEGRGVSLKAWLHWNGEKFDAYLKCAQDRDSDAGFVSHDMPYIQ